MGFVIGVPVFQLLLFGYAINQDELVNGLVQGNGTKIQTIIPTGLLGYNPVTPYKFDPARAKKLLAEAGYPGGLEFELLVSTGICGGGVTDRCTSASRVPLVSPRWGA